MIETEVESLMAVLVKLMCYIEGLVVWRIASLDSDWIECLIGDV